MVRVIMGEQGSGKTKMLLDHIGDAIHHEHGNVICLERGSKLTYDISYKIRLIEADQYVLTGYDCFKGFVGGMYASNYDITHVFISDMAHVVGGEGVTAEMLDSLAWLEQFGRTNNIKFTVTITGNPELASAEMSQYF